MATSCIENIKTPKSISVSRELSWHDLHESQQNISLPFQLTLSENKDNLICDVLLRYLPGKRLVAFGTWQDKSVVIKLFFAKGNAKRHIKREIEGIEKLNSSNTPTPKILWQGSVQKNKIQILIFERINNALSLDLLSHEYALETLLQPLEEITIELATQHVLGIIQEDLHLRNFLLTEKKIYTLDGGSIVQYDAILSKEKSLDHLALFFAQLGVGSEAIQDQLFHLYAKARGWIVKKGDLDFLRHSTLKWVHKRWLDYEKKIQRNSTAFARIKTSRSMIMYDKALFSSELEALLINPEEIFQQYGTQLLKKGRSSTVVKIQLNNRHYVLKRYNLKNKWHALRRAFRKTRALSAWILGQRLRLMNIPTARPVAVIEKRFLCFRGKSYFIMEYIEGSHSGEYFSSTQNDLLLTNTAKKIMALLVNLAKLRLTHGDLKMTNILINQDNPVIIDLDGMKEHRHALGLKRAFKSELKRFMKNWCDQPKIADLFTKLISEMKKT